MQDWKEIYVQHKFPLYLFSQTDLADVLKKRNWPSRLYKYRSFSDFHTNALSDFSVWLSTPIGFNDTRDCSYDINPHRCRIPSDHIPIRSWPLFLARELMRDLIETLKAEQST